jgi:hypothetical protein
MTKYTAEFIDKITDKLPHGSGIDADWYIETKRQTIVASNSYHCMNDVGYYDGWADFTLYIPLKNPMNFKLHFGGQDAQYLNRKYMLRDYLEDTIAECLREAEQSKLLNTIASLPLVTEIKIK